MVDRDILMIIKSIVQSIEEYEAQNNTSFSNEQKALVIHEYLKKEGIVIYDPSEFNTTEYYDINDTKKRGKKK
jgi:hypothetical protein